MNDTSPPNPSILVCGNHCPHNPVSALRGKIGVLAISILVSGEHGCQPAYRDRWILLVAGILRGYEGGRDERRQECISMPEIPDFGINPCAAFSLLSAFGTVMWMS